MKRSTLTHSLLGILLVFIESALTLLLRLDPELRKAAYPLAKNNTLVCLRLYLPHVQIFATFGHKGVLLDVDMPAGRSDVDVIINAYSLQVLNAITTHDTASTEKLQMRGDAEQVHLVKQFFMQLGLGSLIQSIIRRVKGGKNKAKPDDADMAEKKENYKLRIQEQQTQINALSIKNRELETANKELHSKQKVLTISAVIAFLVAIGALLALLIQ